MRQFEYQWPQHKVSYSLSYNVHTSICNKQYISSRFFARNIKLLTFPAKLVVSPYPLFIFLFASQFASLTGRKRVCKQTYVGFCYLLHILLEIRLSVHSWKFNDLGFLSHFIFTKVYQYNFSDLMWMFRQWIRLYTTLNFVFICINNFPSDNKYWFHFIMATEIHYQRTFLQSS